MAESMASLRRKIGKLEEENDDLKVQLLAVTDKLQSLESGVIASPDGNLGGAKLLRDYMLYLATFDPGLTVGMDYDFDTGLNAAKDYWEDQGGNREDLDV